MKKVLCTLLTIALCTSFALMGCAQPAKTNIEGSKQEAAVADKQAEAPMDSEASSAGVELKISGIPGAVSKMLYMAKEQFEAKNPNVNVTITEYPEEQYQNQAPQIFSDASTRPDLSWYWKQVWYNDMANAGTFMPLNDLYESEGWTTAIGEAVVENYRSADGNIYAVCTDVVWTPNIFYNKDIFEKNNLEVPKTMDELYKIAEVLNEQGIIPIAVGATDAVPHHVFNALLQRSVTAEEYTKLLDITKVYDEIKYDSPNVLRAFEELKKMSEKVFEPGAAGINSTEARALFMQGKAAMYSDGSWAASLIEDEKPEDMNVGVFQYPQIYPDIKPNILLFAANSVQIQADTANPELAKEYLKQLMSTEGQSKLASDGIATPSRNDIPDVGAIMGDMYAQMYSDMSEMGSTPLWFTDCSSETLNKTYEIFSSVMAGGTEPKAAAEQLQALFEAEVESNN